MGCHILIHANFYLGEGVGRLPDWFENNWNISRRIFNFCKIQWVKYIILQDIGCLYILELKAFWDIRSLSKSGVDLYITFLFKHIQYKYKLVGTHIYFIVIFSARKCVSSLSNGAKYINFVAFHEECYDFQAIPHLCLSWL